MSTATRTQPFWDLADQAVELVAMVPPPTEDLDAGVVLGVGDRESLCGWALTPAGCAGLGDNGHGHGWGQQDDREPGSDVDPADVFRDANGLGNWEWLAQSDDWKDPAKNIARVAEQLRFNLGRLQGDLAAAIAAYNARMSKVRGLLFAGPLANRATVYSAVCTPNEKGERDYVVDVLRRRDLVIAARG